MRNIDKLKNVLKETASEIRTMKGQFKQAQRTETFDIQWKLLFKLKGLQRFYRHHHIAYCELRGKTRDQIEHKVREHNEPDDLAIKAYKEQYAWTSEEINAYNERKIKNEKVICAC